MKFSQFKSLARIVFPNLPSDFESMPDDPEIYYLLIPFLVPQNANAFDDLNDKQRFDLFSVDNMTFTQIRHFAKFGKSFWDPE